MKKNNNQWTEEEFTEAKKSWNSENEKKDSEPKQEVKKQQVGKSLTTSSANTSEYEKLKDQEATADNETEEATMEEVVEELQEIVVAQRDEIANLKGRQEQWETTQENEKQELIQEREQIVHNLRNAISKFLLDAGSKLIQADINYNDWNDPDIKAKREMDKTSLGFTWYQKRQENMIEEQGLAVKSAIMHLDQLRHMLHTETIARKLLNK